MLVKRVTAGRDALLNPRDGVWSAVAAETVALAGTPLESQPSRYVRAAWKGRAIGAVKEVRVQAAHDGESVFFRLEWADGTENRAHQEADFPDAAALLFPLNGEASLLTMGSVEKPVNAWFWRPNLEEAPQSLTARGVGTVAEEAESAGLEARSVWEGGVWRVVLARALAAANGAAVSLRPGGKTQVAVAVWEGSSGERAGIKAFSQSWRELSLEP